MIIQNTKLYDWLKYLAQVGLPALATFVLAVGNIWHWNATEGIVATIVALDTLLGALLLLTSANFAGQEALKAANVEYNGEVEITSGDDGEPRALLNLDEHPVALVGKKEMRMKVVDKRKE